jgi:hypothetical protein
MGRMVDMSLGSGIAIAGVWLASAAVICGAMVFRESDWMLVAVFSWTLAWGVTKHILEAVRGDDWDEGNEKDSPRADPARS